MKYVVTFVLAVAVSLMMGHVWGPKGGEGAVAAKESAYERVMRTGVLRCGYGVWAPLFYVDANTGERKGIFYEATEEMAKFMGFKVEWVENADWNAMALGIETGRYDAICSGKWVYGAEGMKASYSMPIMYNVVHAYVRADDGRFANIDSINHQDVTLAVQDGAASFDLANEYFPKAKQIAIPSSADPTLMLMNVATRKADVTLIDASTAQGYLEHNPGKLKLLTQDKPIRAYEVVYMFGMGDSKMESMLNSGVRQLHTLGIADRILSKYVSNTQSIYTLRKPYEALK